MCNVPQSLSDAQTLAAGVENSIRWQFQRALLRRLLDAGFNCDVAFDAVTHLSVSFNNITAQHVEPLAAAYAEYVSRTWDVANNLTKSLLQHTPDAHRIPRLAMMIFLRALQFESSK